MLRSAASTVVGVASRAALTAWLTRKAVGAGEEGSEGTLARCRDAVGTADREARFADASAGVVDLFVLGAGDAVGSQACAASNARSVAKRTASRQVVEGASRAEALAVGVVVEDAQFLVHWGNSACLAGVALVSARAEASRAVVVAVHTSAIACSELSNVGAVSHDLGHTGSGAPLVVGDAVAARGGEVGVDLNLEGHVRLATVAVVLRRTVA